MPRTTADLVQKIIQLDVATDDLDHFIAPANSLVTEVCGEAGYDDTRLELIERWLTAHLYTIMRNRRASETVGSVSEWFQYKLGLGLNTSMYGAQVMLLDTKGGFARLSKQIEDGRGPVTATITHLGCTEDDE